MADKLDNWPIDGLFHAMFTHSARSAAETVHPLFHMAWADVCTLDTLENQQVYLSGGSVPYPDPQQVAQHLQVLTWRYLYPSPPLIQSLVVTLVRMIWLFGTEPAQGSEQAKIPLFRDRWDEIRAEVAEFGAGQGEFLQKIYDSLPWDTVLDAHTLSKKPERFQSLRDLATRLNPMALGMSHDEDYDVAAAKGFLGSPETGWPSEGTGSCVSILMNPLRTLFNWAAKQDHNELGGDNETSLGQMDKHLTGFRMGYGQHDRRFMAAHFCHHRENVPTRHFLEAEKLTGARLNQSNFATERHPECKPSRETQSAVRVEFKRLFALTGFNYHKYLFPFIRQLGALYADSNLDEAPPNAQWLWDKVQEARNPLSSGVFDVRPEDTIYRRTWDDIDRRLVAVKAPPRPAQRTVEAPRRSTEGPPETKARLRTGEVVPEKLSPLEVESDPLPDKKSDGNGTTLLWGAAALGALFMFARS